MKQLDYLIDVALFGQNTESFSASFALVDTDLFDNITLELVGNPVAEQLFIGFILRLHLTAATQTVNKVDIYL